MSRKELKEIQEVKEVKDRKSAGVVLSSFASFTSGLPTMRFPAGNRGLEKSIFAHDLVITPEKKLWRGVLEQAYADAELPLGPEADDELFIDQDRARRFLRADTASEEEELRLVCDFADVPFDRVVLWARKHYPLAA